MKKLCIAALLLVAGTAAYAAPAAPVPKATAGAAASRGAQAPSAPPQVAAPQAPAMPRFRFENFTTDNGLPDNHVYSVLVDGDRIWAGTDNGLAVYESGKWKTYTTKDGLAHRAVLTLALDKRTGDVWAGTMAGLSRISGGRIDSYTQLNSGLSNDVVYGVSVEGENVWVATAAGACRLNIRTGEWTLYNERNTPMIEIWTYG
ncbi:MAG: two-component regulator propeller domain-containing protein, partial [Terracidiphilus sp.]